jgi:uncharacterized protein YkwD
MGLLRVLSAFFIISVLSFVFYYVSVGTETDLVVGDPLASATTTTTLPVPEKLKYTMSYANTSSKYATNYSLSWLENRTFDLVNGERVKNNLSELRWSSGITSVAREYSETMAKNDFFAHEGLDGSDVSSRLKDGEVYHWNKSAENLYMSSGYDYYYTNIFGKVTSKHYMTFEQLAQNATQGWMNSPGHRENMLDPDLDESGLGVYVVNETFYFTQNFITRVYCGYKGGNCCTQAGYLPWCYEPWTCESGSCIESD